MRVVLGLLAAITGASSLGSPARGDFVPGDVYVSQIADEACVGQSVERIWRIRPSTGEAVPFYAWPSGPCVNPTGLTFTPDGTGLRASLFTLQSGGGSGAIGEFDRNANLSVVLDSEDGVTYPAGSNNIQYGPDGSFYVAGNSRLLRFPPDGEPAQVLAQNLPTVGGSIAVAPDGSVYWATSFNGNVLHIGLDGSVETFVSYPNPFPGVSARVDGLAVDSEGNVFTAVDQEENVIYRYDGGNPATQQLLASGLSVSVLQLSPDETELYGQSFANLLAIDVLSGQHEIVAMVPTSPGGTLGFGLAVVVPEPGSLILLSIVGSGLLVRLRARAPVGKHRFGQVTPPTAFGRKG